MEAFLVIALLTWAAVSVSGTTPELSTTTGDTVNIPCLFGEGTVRNIYWYYSDVTGHHKILFLSEGKLTIAAEYANRVSFPDDYSTLILTGITVADEGTYQCVVDTLKQPAVSNIKTKLNVFSLPPDTLPLITPCTEADKPSSCSIHANQSFTLTCTLPNVYPVEDTELIWYQNGKHFSSIHDVTQNDDGTTDISRQIKIYETGHFTCNATYISANGRENTAVSVEAWIIPPAHVPNRQGQWMTNHRICQITRMKIGFVLLAAIIILCIYLWKTRGLRSSSKDSNKSDEYQLRQVTSTREPTLPGTSAGNGSTDITEFSESAGPSTAYSSENEEEESELLGKLAEENSKDGKAESSQPTEPPTANSSKNKDGDDSTRPLPYTVRDRLTTSGVTDAMLSKLANTIPSYKFHILSQMFGMEHNQARNILERCNNDHRSALIVCMNEWRNRSNPSVAVLHEILRKAELGGLIRVIDWDCNKK